MTASSAIKSAIFGRNRVSARPGRKARGKPRVFARRKFRNVSQRLNCRRIPELVGASSLFAILGVPIADDAMLVFVGWLALATGPFLRLSNPRDFLHALAPVGEPSPHKEIGIKQQTYLDAKKCTLRNDHRRITLRDGSSPRPRTA